LISYLHANFPARKPFSLKTFPKKLPPKALVAINIFFLGEVLHFELPSVGLVLYLGVNFIIK
jgi:hypothetical protein